MPVAAAAELADGSRSELEKTPRLSAISDELHAAWVGPVGARDAFWVFATAPIGNVLHPEAGHFRCLTLLHNPPQFRCELLIGPPAAPRLPSGPVFHSSVCNKMSRSARCEESVDMECAKILQFSHQNN